jgi:class 3 adenylate cyclase/tetratricopeptide (TPR) repeat protein
MTATANDLLRPYVPRLVIEWLRDSPDLRYRSVPGTFVFADISGFTNLTERLARLGKAGAEEMGDTLNATFEELLAAAYDYGAGLIKWGGDAVLLLFTGEFHAERACRSAAEMQRVMKRIGRLQTSAGPVRLGMSIGVHSGDLDFVLAGTLFRDLVVVGPAATWVTRMETVAQSGEIVISPATAEVLAAQPGLLGAAQGAGVRLRAGPDVGRLPTRLAPDPGSVDLSVAMSAPLSTHLMSGVVDHEHRQACVAFVEFEGTDELLARRGPGALTEAVEEVVGACQVAARDHGVTVLASDVYEDGGKIILIGGAPRNEGDDETRVLGAARRIADAPGVLPKKIGVNCGRVFAGDYGPPYRRTYSVTGDSVNLAARLMAKAGHGEIITTPTVLARCRTPFATKALEPFMVKGKSQPIEAFSVGPLATRAEPTTHQLPFVGRQSELALLRRCAGQAAEGRGQAVELVGAPGLGKTRLLDEFLSGVGYSVLFADGDVYGTSTPYQPLHRLFRHELGLPEDAQADEVRVQLERLTAEVAPHLLVWLPLIGIVAGVDMAETPEVAALGAEARRERLEQVTSEALGLLLAEPRVFVFNDLHFMDEATIGLLLRLVADAAERPWMMIASRRPVSPARLPELAHVHVLELEPLSAELSDRAVAAVTEQLDLPAHRVAALLERAGGNPLYLQELVAAITEGGDEAALPDSVEGVIAARIDRLEPLQRRLLRSAAVLGMRVDRDLLAAVEPETAAGPVSDPFEPLGEFVVRTDDGHLRFAHHLIRQAAYEGLPYRRRTLLHARTADLLERQALNRTEEADLLSMHCLHGERYAAAWEYACVAGGRARERYANADAARCYQRALAAAPHLPSLSDSELAGVSERLSDTYFDLGEFDAAEVQLGRALRHCRADVVWTGQLHLKMALCRESAGRLTSALRWTTKGHQVLEGRDDQPARQVAAQLSARRARIRFGQGNMKDAEVWAQRARAEATASDDLMALARALELIDNVEVWTGRLDGVPPIQEALEIYHRVGDLNAQGRAYLGLGARAYFKGEWNEAIDLYGAAEQAFAKGGREWGAATAAMNTAEILIEQGRTDEAEQRLGQAMRLWRGAGVASEKALCQSFLGHCASRQGRFEEALAFFAEAREYMAPAGESTSLLDVEAGVARVHLRAGQPERARAAVEQTLGEVKRSECLQTTLAQLLRIRGEAEVLLGDTPRGRASLEESLEVARRSGARQEVAIVLSALVRCAVAADAVEERAWSTERDELNALLGFPPDSGP